MKKKGPYSACKVTKWDSDLLSYNRYNMKKAEIFFFLGVCKNVTFPCNERKPCPEFRKRYQTYLST